MQVVLAFPVVFVVQLVRFVSIQPWLWKLPVIPAHPRHGHVLSVLCLCVLLGFVLFFWLVIWLVWKLSLFVLHKVSLSNPR